MGIHNRDYFRGDERGGSFGSTSSWSPAAGSDQWAIKLLIGTCAAVFLLQHMPGGRAIESLLGVDWLSLTRFQLWRPISYAFIHSGFQHIFFNMLLLWILGRVVEAQYGSRETLALFLVGAIVSGVAEVGIGRLESPETRLTVVGASGAIWSIAMVATLLYPRMPMQFLFIPVQIELRWMTFGFFLLDVVMVLTGDGMTVARLAHLSGAAFGAAWYHGGWQLTALGRSGRAKTGRNRSLFQRFKTKVKVSTGAVRGVKLYEPPASPEQFERELDRVLDKINREGKASLSREENEILQQASEKARHKLGR